MCPISPTYIKCTEKCEFCLTQKIPCLLSYRSTKLLLLSNDLSSIYCSSVIRPFIPMETLQMVFCGATTGQSLKYLHCYGWI